MRIRLSQHFIERQQLRNIPKDLAETILREADGHYRDSASNTFVAIKRLLFQGKERDMALSYIRTEEEIILVTLHPLKEGQKVKRIESKRYIAYEPESLL